MKIEKTQEQKDGSFMRKISYVIPCYNSEHTIKTVVLGLKEMMKESLKEYRYEIILVNDGSPDNLHQVIKRELDNDPCVHYIRLAKNFSQHNAVMAGLNHACGDIIVCMDDDGQTSASEVPKLVRALNDEVDVAYAKYPQKKHSVFRNLGSKVNDYMLKIMLGKPSDLYISSFFAIKSFVKDEMIKYYNPYPYLGGLILRITNRVINVEVEHFDRNEGSSNYSLKKLLKLYVNGLTNFSVKPLRVSLTFSILFAIIAFIFTIYLTINKLMNPTTPIGWTSTMIVILIVGAAITFLLGVIGEYIGRIYISINKIPQYVEVRENKKEEN